MTKDNDDVTRIRVHIPESVQRGVRTVAHPKMKPRTEQARHRCALNVPTASSKYRVCPMTGKVHCRGLSRIAVRIQHLEARSRAPTCIMGSTWCTIPPSRKSESLVLYSLMRILDLYAACISQRPFNSGATGHPRPRES